MDKIKIRCYSDIKKYEWPNKWPSELLIYPQINMEILSIDNRKIAKIKKIYNCENKNGPYLYIVIEK